MSFKVPVQAYLESVVDKYKLRPYFKLQHRLIFAKYSEDTGKWVLKIRRQIDSSDGTDFEEFEDTADVLFTGLGGLSRWRWPDIEGLEQFQGQVIHSAQWQTREGGDKWEETVESWGDKRIGVIGLVNSVCQMSVLFRVLIHTPRDPLRFKLSLHYSLKSPIWSIMREGKRGSRRPSSVTRFCGFPEAKTLTTVRNILLSSHLLTFPADYFTAEDKEAFKDPDYYKKFRREVESELNVKPFLVLPYMLIVCQAAHPATMRGHPLQEGAKALFKEDMHRRLSKKPWIADHRRRPSTPSILLPDICLISSGS